MPVKQMITLSITMISGRSSLGDIMSLARESVSRDLLGIMVWYCSGLSGLQYQGHQTWDCAESEESIQAYIQARQYFDDNKI